MADESVIFVLEDDAAFPEAENAVLDPRMPQESGIENPEASGEDGDSDHELENVGHASSLRLLSRKRKQPLPMYSGVEDGIAGNDRLTSSFRPPHRSRKQPHPKPFVLDKEAPKDGATSSNPKSILDLIKVPEPDIDCLEAGNWGADPEHEFGWPATSEMPERLPEEWLQAAAEGFKIRNVSQYIAVLRARRAAALAAAETEASEETMDAGGPRSSMPFLLLLGAFVAFSVLLCVLLYILRGRVGAALWWIV